MRIAFVRFLSLLMMLLLTACSSITTPKGEDFLGHKVQCMRYFIYEICVRDFDVDNEVDFAYFNDTKETFLYRADLAQSQIVDLGFPMHRCVQVLNKETQQAANKLLLIDKTDPAKERSRVKKAMVDSYSSYAPRVKACNKKYNNEVKLPDLKKDSFGEEEFEEF